MKTVLIVIIPMLFLSSFAQTRTDAWQKKVQTELFRQEPNQTKTREAYALHQDAMSLSTRESESELSVSIEAGIGVPVGMFGENIGQEAGLARTGFLARGEINFPLDHVVSGVGSIAASFNKRNASGQGQTEGGVWNSVFPMAGVCMTTSPDSLRFFAQGQLGLFIGSSPEIATSSGRLSSGSATAFAFGFAGGLIVIERIKITFGYLHTSPRFNVTLSSSQVAAGGTMQQSISIIFVTVGIIL